MADEPPSHPLYEIPYLRLFPWLRLVRSPGAAIDPKRLMLGALGLVLLHVGWDGLDRVFPSSSDLTPPLLTAWEPIGEADWASTLARLAEPVRVAIAPFRVLFGLHTDLSAFAHAGLAALWVVVVWGLIGGAIARIAVVGLARAERVGLSEALRFAISEARQLIGTPLIPLLGVVLVAALLGAFGLLYRIPGPSGAIVAGLLAFLPLLGGLVLALIVVGLAVGWPLMHASIAAEADDGFDAMSRTYAYVHQRPWHYAGYVALVAVVGSAGLLFVELFARLVVHLTAWGLSFGGPAITVETLYAQGNAVISPAASAVHGFWLSAVGLLVRGWVYSYFWTTATTSYLLLRHDVDGTPWGTITYQGHPNPLLEVIAEAKPDPSPTGAPTSTVPAPHTPGLRDPGEVSGV